MEINKYKKLFIGKSSKNSIYNFSTQEPIITYESTIGNSNVVYPFAISNTFNA